MIEFFSVTIGRIAWVYILLPCVFFGGIYYSFKTRFLQFRKFKVAIGETLGKVFKKQTASVGTITPFQAVTTALAATVGTGNIIGTAQAIALGGYGAVFWLWVAATLGMIIKYAEITLAIKFREKNKAGEWVGGPMYYIKNGLKKRYTLLAFFFSIFTFFASFGIGNLSQSNSISDSVKTACFSFFPNLLGLGNQISFTIGIITALAVGTALLGGIKRIGKTTEFLVPFMSLLYILFCLIVIIFNRRNFSGAVIKILLGAFNPKAVLGASSGIMLKHTITWGLRRSAFSNEAGLGSAAIAHAAADTDFPAKQGLYGIFEVFIDTILVCSLTALTIISSGIKIPFGKAVGSSLMTEAFSTVFGLKFASLFVAISLTLFAFSTLIGWSVYGERSIEFLLGEKAIKPYKFLFVVMIVVGSTLPLDAVWNMADTFNGLMAIPNFFALFLLSGVVLKETKLYFKDL